MYRLGIVGLGHVATHQVAGLAHSDALELAAVCDPDRARLRAFGDNRRTFTDLTDMLSESDLDVVVVATPNRLHVEHGVQVLEAGKWLVMEKPVAETRDGFEAVARARERRRGHCTIALHAAFGQEVEWFCRPGTMEELGIAEIDSFTGQFYDPYFENGHLLARALSLGGSWMDSGINALSVMARLIPLEWLVIGDSRLTRVADVDCSEVQGTVDFEIANPHFSGSGRIETNWTLGRDLKVTTLRPRGSDRRIVLDHSAQQVRVRSSQGEEVVFACANGLPRLTNHYIGVFGDLARQLELGEDNFDLGRALHELLYDAEAPSLPPS